MISFDHFTYTYPGASLPALSGVCLEIPQGAFVLVAGPSGAGKSTLLRSLNGLVPHFSGGQVSGRVSVAGHDPIAQGPAVLSCVMGLVFQDPEAQFVVNRVEDEIAFALENAGAPLDAMRQQVERALALLGLSDMRRRSLEHLSGGEMQRVAIASALALQPQVLALDEPTSQLDPQSAAEVLTALVRLNRELGLTIVISEHRLERVAEYATQLVYVQQGQVLSGAPRQILAQMAIVPPVVALGRALDWRPLPLTVQEARPFAQNFRLPAPHSPESQKEREKAGDLILQVQDLRVAYNNQAVLCGLDLSMRKGEIVALVGRNGAGKTTLLRAIVGLLKPQHGHISIAGRSTAGRAVADICRQVAFLPQNPNALLFADTIEQELLITLRNHHLSIASQARAKLLNQLGLGDLAQAYPRDLSVGQRQRAALAAIAVTQPALLLLDEPTRGLDYEAKGSLAQLVRSWRDEGAAVLLVTHDVELVARLADRVAVLEGGKIARNGPPAQVLSDWAAFAPQMARLFPGSGWLTVEDVLRQHLPGKKETKA